MAESKWKSQWAPWIALTFILLLTPSLGADYDYDYGFGGGDASVEAEASASIEAEASASIEAEVSASIEAEASASIEAEASAKLEAEASASIHADISASADIEASASVEAGIEASASIEAGIGASASIEAGIEASASIEADISASASLDAEISASIDAEISASIDAEIIASASIEAEVSASASIDVSADVSASFSASGDVSISEEVQLDGSVHRSVHRHIGALGSIKGLVYTAGAEEVEAYLGIRYAEAPVGHLRFQLPVPVSSFDGIFDATTLRPACYQYSEFPYPWANDDDVFSEDCLHLNIYVPRHVETTGRLPVVFYVHGGFFHLGSNRKDIYDGRWLASIGDVIVVTPNYRLGALGYLYSENEEHNVPGNAGLHDVLTALKWVNENIVHFNGDRESITIVGHDAGSVITGLFLTSPLTEGLFRRAVMIGESPAHPAFKEKETSLNLSKKLAEKLHCHNKGYSSGIHTGLDAGFSVGAGAGAGGYGVGGAGAGAGGYGVGAGAGAGAGAGGYGVGAGAGAGGYGVGAGAGAGGYGAGAGAGGYGAGAGAGGYGAGAGAGAGGYGVGAGGAGVRRQKRSPARYALDGDNEFGENNFGFKVFRRVEGEASFSGSYEGSLSEKIKESVSFSDSESASFVVVDGAEDGEIIGGDVTITQSWTDCLRNLDPLDIVKAQVEFTHVDLQNFSPHFGDEFVPESPRDSFVNLNFHEGIDLLVGNTYDEGSNIVTAYPEGLLEYGFYGEISEVPQDHISKLINRHFKIKFDDSRAALDFYAKKGNLFADDGKKAFTPVGDYLLTCPNVYTAQQFAEKSTNNVYYYVFNHYTSGHAFHLSDPLSRSYASWQGSAHGEDVQYIFGLPHKYLSNYTFEEISFSTNVVDMFATFAKTGCPRSDFPKYSRSEPYFEYLVSDVIGAVEKGPHNKNCEFLRPHLGFDIELPVVDEEVKEKVHVSEAPLQKIEYGGEVKRQFHRQFQRDF